MKLSKIAFAAAALVATSAFAAPADSRIALSAGASAIQNNLRLALRGLCTDAGGTPTDFGTGNYTTVVCANTAVTTGTYASKPNSEFINFAGTNFAEARVNVSNGSFGNIQILNGVVFDFFSPATNAPAAAPAAAVIVGGFNDVEPTAFPGTTTAGFNLGSSSGAGVAQVFGVAASNALYTKMFDAQKAAGVLPPSCNVGDTGLSYCVPTIGKAQMASIMNNNDFNAAYSKGLGFLTGNAADDGTELRYVRRVDTSGTQASAQNYFLGLPCSQASLAVVAEPTSDDEPGGLKDVLLGAIRVYAAGGTSNVRSELNKPGVFALGVVSGENNQTGQNWRWLRVNGVAMAENAVPGTAGNTNSATMKNGSYDFYFETTYSGDTAFLSVVANRLNTLTAPVGLVNAADLAAGYTKNGLTCLGSVSN
jgi:hypothetical protein